MMMRKGKGSGYIRSRSRLGIRIIAMMCAMASAGVIAMLLPASSHAAGAAVSVSIDGGSMHTDSATKLKLSGSGFQSVQGGFGGIYVLFGWVSDPQGDAWRPSRGGVTGKNYRYVADDESNPVGLELFVAFPGSSTESAANGGLLKADGTWGATLTVPGARFTSKDRQGNPTNVDCTTQQCGVITIGAHGVVNANNETFTPVSFAQTNAASTQNDAQNQAASSAQSTGSSAGSGTSQSGQNADEGQSSTVDTATSTPSSASTVVQSESSNTMTWTRGLTIAALVVFGLSIIVLAAGVGGYLAATSLLLGVSPKAMEREIGKRQRAADAMRARQERKTLRHKRRSYRQLAKESAAAARDGMDVPSAPGDADAAQTLSHLLPPTADPHTFPADTDTDTNTNTNTGQGPTAPTRMIAVTPPAAYGAGTREFFVHYGGER